MLRLSGASIEDRGDHLVVTSPDNPGYHWGNFLLVTDPQARNDASRCVGLFRATFPDARHLCIGLPAEPDPEPWAAFGLPVTSDEVMSTTTLPAQRPAPDGYSIPPAAHPGPVGCRCGGEHRGERPHRGGARGRVPGLRDWRMRSRAELSERGAAAFFGAFVGDECVSNLGIVLCGKDAQGRVVARYQSVQTAVDHRRRGLAGHLVGVAAGWAADRGAQRWVIATESDNPAGRLYRSLGFAPDSRSWQVERS